MAKEPRCICDFGIAAGVGKRCPFKRRDAGAFGLCTYCFSGIHTHQGKRGWRSSGGGGREALRPTSSRRQAPIRGRPAFILGHEQDVE